MGNFTSALLGKVQTVLTYVSASPSSAYAPTQFAAHPKAEGMTKRALRSAMEALFHRGEIEIAQHGKGWKARSHIARKGVQDAE